MRNNLGERITVNDMARAAMYSKFHFSRVFHRVTGISPGRFLSAIRLQEAKRLLAVTSCTVTEISYRVGYNSVGTFGSRFTSSVGVPPTVYRQYGGFPCRVQVGKQRALAAARSATTTVRGHVRSLRADVAGPIFVGLFPDPLPEGVPVACCTLPRAGAYVLERVPTGTWHVLAHAPSDGYDDEDPTAGASVAAHGPITIRPETGTRAVDLWLHPMRIVDPPALLALLDRAPAVSRQDVG
ncbi:helix-turn-helix transcriptional regulator [Amycolatopsis anabasis]|uniref:helix-turn-helix transcriptional regulator n=1 Tax=Amycolatopsis anabasis TaxID=1840409 RepID=UPI001C550700|nr:helix-turn-helix transcriptional regulator [Amycolatopsis anabasis]